MSTETWPQYHKNIQYSKTSSLNTLEVCLPRPTTNDPKLLWVIYIHGGAWFDNHIEASSFGKTQDLVLHSSEVNHIAGFASINYRLSPNSCRPQDPSNPSDPARNAKHPDHINDVLEALLHLQQTYAFGDRYILVGHSCGAALAMQVAMSRQWSATGPVSQGDSKVVPPCAILPVEGIYDLPALIETYGHIPLYTEFVKSAFSSDENVWKAVSPAAGKYSTTWPNGKLVVIAHSHEDELVEWRQADLLESTLKGQGWGDGDSTKTLKIVELKGKHDQVWDEGEELAKAIKITVGLMVEKLK